MTGERQAGFSLIEAAIVIAIIGVVLVSVLQGRELIASAEYKSFRKALGEYAEAFHAFRERYNALPGDFAQAASDLGQTDGNGNGIIDDGPQCSAGSDESCTAWQHLRAAALLRGNPDDAGGAASPSHPYNGTVSGFFTGSDGNGEFGHKILIDALPAEVARRLDDHADDGLCDDGRVSALAGCSGSDWPTDTDVSVVYAL